MPNDQVLNLGEPLQQDVFKFLGIKSPQKAFAAPELLLDFTSYDGNIPQQLYILPDIFAEPERAIESRLLFQHREDDISTFRSSHSFLEWILYDIKDNLVNPDRARLEALAYEYIREDKYLFWDRSFAFKTLQPLQQLTESLLTSLEAATHEKSMASQIVQWADNAAKRLSGLTASALMASNWFSDFKQQAWDALYALTYLPSSERPQEREDVISCIRIIHALEIVATRPAIIDPTMSKPESGGLLTHKSSRGGPIEQPKIPQREPIELPEVVAGPADIERMSSMLRNMRRLLSVTPLLPQEFFPKVASAIVVSLIGRNIISLGTSSHVRPVEWVTPRIGDLHVVNQTLLKYTYGEVAHIENVMRTEERKRTHRMLTRSEEIRLTEEETTTENEKDLTSTDRFEVSSEASNTIESDSKLEAGVTVTASYGPTVSLTAKADYATHSAQSDATKSASSYARSVTERSVEKVSERIRKERTVKTLNEVEEINEHNFVNTSDSHAVGIYCWANKLYSGQVMNYGKRLLLDIVVPNPAAYYIYNEQRVEALKKTGTLEEPTPPSQIVDDYGNITKDTFKKLNDAYHLQDVKPEPPRETIKRPFPFSQPYANMESQDERLFVWPDPDDPHKSYSWYSGVKKHKIDDGYKAKKISAAWTSTGREKHEGGQDTYWSVLIGDAVLKDSGMADIPKKVIGVELNDEMGELEAVIHSQHYFVLDISMEIECERTEEALERWQWEVWSAAWDAYTQKKTAYDEQKRAESVSAMPVVGKNPEQNREIEREELKKQCISMLTTDRFNECKTTREYEPSADECKELVIQLVRQITPEKGGAVEAGRIKGGRTGMGEYEEALGTEFARKVCDVVRQWASKVSEEQGPPHIISPGEMQRIGRFIQWFEEMFEWDQMTYIFYPYFWRPPQDWPETLANNDLNDPLFTKFMQAGAARVTIPVKPPFNDEFLYYLQFERLWNGGDAPLIGDDLFMSLAYELKSFRQVEQLAAAVPIGEPWTFTVPTSLIVLPKGEQAENLPDYTTSSATVPPST